MLSPIERAIAEGRDLRGPVADRDRYAPVETPDLNTPEAYAEAAKCWTDPVLWQASVPHRGSIQFFIHGAWDEQQALIRAANIWVHGKRGPFLEPTMTVERVAASFGRLAA